MINLDDYTVNHQFREHREIEFPVELRKEVYNALAEEGYRVDRSGPYTDANMWPKVDVNRGKVHASRYISNPES